MEFRLSDESVSNFEEYKTEVARYAGMSWDELIVAERNGTYEGWQPVWNWMQSQGCTYPTVDKRSAKWQNDVVIY